MYNIKSIIDQQRRYFATGATLPISFRIEQLKKLKSLLEMHETDIVDALHKDLHKAPTEALVNEILTVTDEINFIIRHLKRWARPQKVSSPFPLLFPGRSELHYEPYGTVFIIGPWNYPFLLIMSPLIGAMCAGNCAVLKPSELAVNTQNVLTQLITDHFSSEYIAAIKAGPEQVNEILKEKFDYIFFTGGTKIGKIVMQAAANYLTPVTLELGGKSPCIVDETANINFAARRIAWAKFLNAGQTCIAPDFLYIKASCKAAFISQFQAAIKQFYGENPEMSADYGRIINKKHFERISKLLQKGKIVFGGTTKEDQLYISPTLIDSISWDDPIMQEEIFGPVLPILTYEKFDELIDTLKAKPKPLALYLFTNNKSHEQKVLQQLSFGGGCINDCLIHEVNLHLPFGGVDQSGMGQYHGKYSFETFSHRKSIYKKLFPIEFKLEYPPYTERKLSWLRWLLRT